VPTAIIDVPGARGIRGASMLAPTREFGQPILGIIGEASAEVIAASNGMVGVGDQVGVTGIELRFDEQLRGTPGDTIVIRVKEAPPPANSDPSTGAVPEGASSAPSGTAENQTTAVNPGVPVTVYEKEPVRADPLQISLDVTWQMRAESVLAGVQSPASAVVIRPSTGAILAAANSPASSGQPDANWGAYAPGSTFKLVTTLALLRHGYTPDSTVECPTEVMIGGQTFHNTPGYPASANGTITLTNAFAYSCNTAFISAAQNLTDAEFQDAANSLGLGIDYTTGAQINFGTIPAADSQAGRAQEAIGQGGVLVSPVAMAGVVASVVAGKTTIPWVVALQKPVSTAPPLTTDEADQLLAMMGQVVAVGSARDLADVLIGAKTGTAEWGEAPPYKTHAWMLGATDQDIAVVVWVKDGESGAATAGPIMRQLVQAAGGPSVPQEPLIAEPVGEPPSEEPPPSEPTGE
jgi:cell division protein FtsI/penicillin-binding protein 2